jgi:hypothetical protein
MLPTFREIQVLKSVNKQLSQNEKKWAKNYKNVFFSKSGKWHDPKNTEIISKILGTTCHFPDLKPVKQLKNRYATFFWV